MEKALEDLIGRYGLLAVFVGGATEGDGTMVVTGALAHLGYFNFVVATAVGCVGALGIDMMWYGLGRWRADAIRQSRIYVRTGPTVERLAARVGMWEILVARFILGVRIPSMIFWGTQQVSLARFAVLDAAGCVLWGSVLAGVGYAFSSSFGLLLEGMKRTERHLMIMLVAVALVLVLRPFLWGVIRRRVQRNTEPRTENPD